MATMTIICGAPGSGKSTWAAKNRPGVAVCSADNFFVSGGKYNFDVTRLGAAHGQCFRDAVSLIQSGYDLVVDNTNTSIVEMAPYYTLAKAWGYNVEVIILDCPPEVAYERNVHGVPLKGVMAMAERCDKLTFPPFWEVKVTEVITG